MDSASVQSVRAFYLDKNKLRRHLFWTIGFLIFLGIAPIILGSLVRQRNAPTIIGCGIVLAIIAAVLIVLQILVLRSMRPTLEIEPSGLRFHCLHRDGFIHWQDIDDIVMYALPDRSMKFLGIVPKPHTRVGWRIHRSVTVLDHSSGNPLTDEEKQNVIEISELLVTLSPGQDLLHLVLELRNVHQQATTRQ